MPLDGIVVRNIVYELKNTIINGKIDKVSQPEKDEIILTIRNNNKNYKLLLSSNPSYPKVHLTSINKTNPINAPMFCMVLRKHLVGGKIINIEQFNLDRIIKIFIESYDELGNLSTKTIICEIMGRHSNITLINNNNIIIDSIKHLTPDISSFRQLLPGLEYKNPPFHNKIEIDSFSAYELVNRFNDSNNIKLIKFITNNINGFSTIISREICHNSNIDEDTYINDIEAKAINEIVSSIQNIINTIKKESFEPCIYNNEYNEPVEFYSFMLGHLNNSIWNNTIYKFEEKSISKVIESFYFNKENIDRLKQKAADITKIANNNLSRCQKKLSIQDEKLFECNNKDNYKLFGDIIMSNLYGIKKGDSKASLINYFDETNSIIDIPLDISFTPIKNAQNYYKKYNKAKSAELIILKQKSENIEEINYLENILFNLENCSSADEIDEIRNELISEGYINKKKKGASRAQKKSLPMHYISTDGFDIYVGKNNLQNDFLTLKFASPSDIWLHTKNIPGSHVIIKTNNKEIPDTTLYQAACLAAYFSKAKNSTNVPIDYTYKKNIKKPNGAKPGMVIYFTNKSIFINSNEDNIKFLKRIQ